MSTLAWSIYQTLAFFDVQDIPLTLMDIRAYLVKNSPLSPLFNQRGEGGVLDEGGQELLSLTNIQTALAIELKELVSYQKGFYFLAGREDLVTRRKERYRISLKRLSKAKKFLGGLRFLPYVRAVAISGSLSFLNSKPSSDIDLLIITKPGRIWLTRFLVSSYFQIWGQRRHGKYIADRFCLNHYIREDFTVTRDRDLFTAEAYTGMLPVLGAKVLEKFWQQNPWLHEFLQDPLLQKNNHFFGFEFSLAQRLLEWTLDWTLEPLLNWLLGRYQRRRIRPREDVVVSDDELSFHFRLHGEKVLASFRDKLADLAA